MRRHGSKHGHVYFVREGLAGPIKVGRSWNPRSRVSRLVSGNVRPLRLLGFLPWAKDAAKAERAVQRRFQDSHVWNEWFEPTPELLAFILAYAIPYDPAQHNDRFWGSRRAGCG